MSLRRGFKTEANAYAREMRREQGLADHAPLCPWKLAEHLAIPILRISDLSDEIDATSLAYFSGIGSSTFSAVTVFKGPRRLIVHNDNHHLHRQAANIAHELAHGLLGHPPAPPLTDAGCRNFNRELEDEANWLGPALLVSDEAAFHIARQAIPIAQAIVMYGVSRELLSMRLQVSGANVRVARAKAKFGR